MKNRGKTQKPAPKGKVKDLPARKLTTDQERSVKGGGTKNPKPKGDMVPF